MKNLKYLLFLIPFLFSINVYATNTNVSSKIKYDPDLSSGTYKGDEIQLGGSSSPYSVGTRYNGRLSLIEFYLSTNDYNFDINHTYTITLNMATNDWRNNFMAPQVLKANSYNNFQSGSLSVSNFQFVSRKQIKFNFKTGSTLPPYLFFRLYSTDYASNNTIAITGDNNWNLSSIYINDNVSSSGSGSSGSSGSGSTINNNVLSCSNGLTITSTTYNDTNSNIIGYYINSSGTLVANSGYNVISYIPIKPDTNYQIKKTTSTGDVPSYCLSSTDSSYGFCTAYNTNNTFAFNSGNNIYLSFSIKPDETIYLSYCASSIEIDNQNTQNIIDNANQNTTDIINNNNDNTQQILDGLQIGAISINDAIREQTDKNKVCSLFDKNSIFHNNSVLSNTGVLVPNDSFGVSDYISISKNDNLKIILTLPSNVLSRGYYCFYNINKSLISCNNSRDISPGLVVIPDNTSYVMFSINKELNKPQFEICRNGNQAIADSITDSNIDNDTGHGFFDDFTSEDFGLSQIITIPLNTIQNLTSSSCVALNVPIPFTNGSVSLPCMTQVYEQNIPTIYNLWKIVSFGIISYFIAIDIFHIVKGFKDPESDKVEVLDL